MLRVRDESEVRSMDEARYEELMRKRTTSGLSDAEANELGRMMAEKKGETYGGAAARKAAFEDAEAEEQRMREHSGSEGHTAPRDAKLKGTPSGTQPGAGV
jgi:hypothetical protein